MENRDQKKSQLENIAKSASDAIQNQLVDYKDKGKNLLIIGGIIVAAYAITKVFSDDTEEDESVEKKSESSFVGTALTGVVTSVLLTLAKNKILELIEQLNQNEETKG
jgi:uncharacterized membrane protein YidH (DUF202 family)